MCSCDVYSYVLYNICFMSCIFVCVHMLYMCSYVVYVFICCICVHMLYTCSYETIFVCCIQHRFHILCIRVHMLYIRMFYTTYVLHLVYPYVAYVSICGICVHMLYMCSCVVYVYLCCICVPMLYMCSYVKCSYVLYNICFISCVSTLLCGNVYWVATISRLLKIIGLFCKRAL